MPQAENKTAPEQFNHDLPHIIDLFRAPSERTQKRRLKREIKQLLKDRESTLTKAINSYDQSISQLERESRLS